MIVYRLAKSKYSNGLSGKGAEKTGYGNKSCGNKQEQELGYIYA